MKERIELNGGREYGVNGGEALIRERCEVRETTQELRA
jgi:hypothetical protein